LNEVFREVGALAGTQPTVIFESTGHYHMPVSQFLEQQNYPFIIVNPLVSHQAKRSSSLRKVKTDVIDACRLASSITRKILSLSRSGDYNS